MLFRPSTLTFFRKRHRISYNSPFLGIFEDASCRLNYPCNKLVRDCAEYLGVPFVEAVPAEAEILSPQDIVLSKCYILTSIGENRAVFGVCPTMVPKSGRFYLASGSVLVSFLQLKLIERIRKWS